MKTLNRIMLSIVADIISQIIFYYTVNVSINTHPYFELYAVVRSIQLIYIPHTICRQKHWIPTHKLTLTHTHTLTRPRHSIQNTQRRKASNISIHPSIYPLSFDCMFSTHFYLVWPYYRIKYLNKSLIHYPIVCVLVFFQFFTCLTNALCFWLLIARVNQIPMWKEFVSSFQPPKRIMDVASIFFRFLFAFAFAQIKFI